MDWITDTVAIGTREEAHDASVLRTAGIRSVLCLDGTLAADAAVELGLSEVVSVALCDGSGNDPREFRRAVAVLGRLAATRAPVLVQCQYGRSRSPAVVAGYLVVTQGLDPFQAREFVA